MCENSDPEVLKHDNTASEDLEQADILCLRNTASESIEQADILCMRIRPPKV